MKTNDLLDYDNIEINDNDMAMDSNFQRISILDHLSNKIENAFQLQITQKEDLLNTTIEEDAKPVSIFDKISIPEFKQEYKSTISFNPIQEWEGYVVDIEKDSFTAQLVDITDLEHCVAEVAEFPILDLSDNDIPLLQPGAVFRWSLGYTRSNSGVKRRVSQIVFRQLPKWTRSDIEKANSKANKFANTIVWE